MGQLAPPRGKLAHMTVYVGPQANFHRRTYIVGFTNSLYKNFYDYDFVLAAKIFCLGRKYEKYSPKML